MFTKSRLALAVMAVSSGFVYAEEAPVSNATLFDQVTVSATRTEKQVKDVAGSVTVIDSEQIEKELATDIKDLIRFEPGVTMKSDGRTGSEGYNIRGMDGNRVRIMVDGVDQSQQFDSGYTYLRSQRNFIDVDALKAVEIVKGPGSTLYGSDAIGGIVAYQTKDPADYLKASGDDTAASIKGSYTSANEGFSETFTIADRTGDLESMFLYTRRDHKETDTHGGADVYGSARGEADPLDRGSNNFLAKLQYQVNDAHRVGVTGEFLDARADIDLKTSEASDAEEVATGKDKSTRSRVGVFHEWEASSALFDQLKWSFDWQKTKQDQDTHMPAYMADFGGGMLFPMDERLKEYEYFEDSLQFNAQFDKNITAGSVNHDIIYGFNVTRTDIENRNKTTYLSGRNQGNVVHENGIPFAESTEYGIFIQDDIQLTDRFSFSPGLRYDSYEYKPGQNDSFTSDMDNTSDSKLTGRIGSVYKLNDNLSAFAQYSQGFKTPGLYEMYFTQDGGSYRQDPNPDLKPEESNSIELGIRGDNSAGSFEVTAFYNKYTDFIENVTTYTNEYPNGLSQYDNVGKARIKGVEFRGELWLDEVLNAPVGTALRGSIAYADGENKENGEKLNSVAPLTAVLGLGYDDVTGKWGNELVWTLVKGKSGSNVSNDDVLEDEEQYNPAGYGLVDFTAYYRPVTDVTLRAGLFNITDKKYYLFDDVRGRDKNYEGLDRYSQPGRNFSVSVKWDI